MSVNAFGVEKSFGVSAGKTVGKITGSTRRKAKKQLKLAVPKLRARDTGLTSATDDFKRNTDVMRDALKGMNYK